MTAKYFNDKINIQICVIDSIAVRSIKIVNVSACNFIPFPDMNAAKSIKYYSTHLVLLETYAFNDILTLGQSKQPAKQATSQHL